MSTTVSRISARLSRLSLSNGVLCASWMKQAAEKPSKSEYLNALYSREVASPFVERSLLHLPGSNRSPRVYTFPAAIQKSMQAPAPFLQQLIEKFDPTINKTPIEAPPTSNASTAIYAAPRLLTIRRKKMKKHKRRKRYDRDFFKYAKYHREKKLKAEKAFRARMKGLLAELNAFSAENYVKDVIQRAKREWTTEMAPSGRKLYPHWSSLMSLEELYGLPKSDYIDKRAGLPGEEDKEKIRQLRIDYYRQFCGENIEVRQQNKQSGDSGNK
uniref:Mitochondrial mRNA-processing protein COX24 C-terminal domain-containing protein n=1 Tax=Parascaris univalens TaxID=6257 RepID=A0A915BDC4_PARUN